MTDGTQGVQGADDSRGAGGEQEQHGLAPGKASPPAAHDDDPAADLIAELVAAMNTPVNLEGRDMSAAMVAGLEATSLNLWRCPRCDGWVGRRGGTGPSQHIGEDLTTLTAERAADLANEAAGAGWGDPLEGGCPPPSAAAAHNRRELAAAEAYSARLVGELATAHNARLLALMGDPPAVVVGAGTPEDPYRELTTPLIASHCLGPEPWWARHERPLRVALWGVVVLVGVCTLVSVFTAGPGVWLRGLFGATVGAVTLLMTRGGRRGWGPR